MKIKWKDQKGITLVEMLITLALFSIVIGVLFGVFAVSNRAYKSGSDQSFQQKDARLAARVIEKQLRNAKDIGANPLDGDFYYSLKLEKQEGQGLGSLVLERIEGASSKKTSFGNEFKEISFEKGEASNILNYSLVLEKYEISSAIKLNNQPVGNIPSGTTVLYFTLIDDNQEEE